MRSVWLVLLMTTGGYVGSYDSGHRLDSLDELIISDPDTLGSLSIFQVLRRLARDPSNPQFTAFTSLLGSRTCGGRDVVSRYLDNSTASLTLWLPTDQAVWAALDGRKVPIRGWTCDPSDPLGMRMGEEAQVSNLTDPLNSRGICLENPVPRDPSDFTNLPARQLYTALLPCIRDLLLYHITPARQILLLADLDGLSRATAIATTALTPLNSWLVNLQPPESQGQALVIDQRRPSAVPGDEEGETRRVVETRLFYGGLPASRVIRANITCANGVIHVIDRMMFPPTNLTRTLELLRMPFYLGALRSGSQERLILRQPSVTIFLPEAALQKEPGSPEQVYERLAPPSFNYADYTFPDQLVYANRTGEGDSKRVNLTSLSGIESFVSYTADFGMLLNGTMRIIRPNILIQNGVLHVFANRTY